MAKACSCQLHKGVVEELKNTMPPEEDLSMLSVFFKVFGDPTRLKILWALDGHEMCVCDIAALLSMTSSAVSHQLGYLRQNRLVTQRREGKSVFYALADSHIHQIFAAGMEHISE